MSKRILWAENTFGSLSDEYINTYINGNATCMLPAGHDGPHEWTPDDEIVVAFEPRKDAGTERP